MTLHLFGVVDGSLLTMSDGRTSRNNAVATDEAHKVSLYPSAEEFAPGRLACILLVSGRAEFRTNHGEIGPGATVDAAAAIDQYLARADLRPLVSLGDLVDAIWKNVIAPLWWLCPDCCIREAEDAEIFADDFDGESTCDAHDALLTLRALGFDEADANLPKLYERTWIVGATSMVLANGTLQFDVGDDSGMLAEESTPSYDELCRYFATFAERVNSDWFAAATHEAFQDAQVIHRDARVATAEIECDTGLTGDQRTEKLKAVELKHEAELELLSEVSTVGPIGGRVVSFILNPVLGFQRQPDWSLPSSANDGRRLYDRSKL